MTDKLISGAIGALNGLSSFLDEASENAETAKAAADQYNQLKGRLGSSEIASKLGLKEPELPFFEASVRDAGRRLDIADDADETSRRNASIAALRFLSWLETIRSNGINIEMPEGVDAAINEDVGRKQIRALELIIRSLIDERYGSQDNLETELKNLFKPAVVDKWKQSGDQGDLLSGTTFSEIASLFVNKQEYSNYEKLYGETAFLNYLRDRRKTIQNFLDDIRRVRNTLAHNKAVSNTQLSLLALYYEELISPIQDAYDEGETKIDPSTYLDVSAEELDGYFSNLHEDIEGVKDDIADFRASVEGALGLISEDTKEIKQTTEQVKSRTGLIAAGVAVLLIGVGAIYFITSGTKEDTAQIKQDTTSIKETTERTDQNVSDIKTATEETSQATQEIKASISDMAEGVKALAKTGGLVAKPSNPAEFYHNARILTQRGEVDRAVESYKKLFSYEFISADPIIDFVSILRQKYGETNLANIIDQFIPPTSKILNAYAKMLMSPPSSKELEFWLSTKPLFLPAVPEIVKHSENQPFNLTRYLLQTELEKAFMTSNVDRGSYYIDPIRADADFLKVKLSYEKTNWSYYKNARKSPLFFYTEGHPNIGRGQVNFAPWLIDELGTRANGKYQIRILATGEYKSLLKGYKINVDDWNDFENNSEYVFKGRKFYGYFKTVEFREGIFAEGEEYPYVSDLPKEQNKQHICASWLHKGELLFDVKWIDNENVERVKKGINLCPKFGRQPDLLNVEIVRAPAETSDMKANLTNLIIADITPIYQPGSHMNIIGPIRIKDEDSGETVEIFGPKANKDLNFKFDAGKMVGFRDCMSIRACPTASDFKKLQISFQPKYKKFRVMLTIAGSENELPNGVTYTSNPIIVASGNEGKRKFLNTQKEAATSENTKKNKVDAFR